MNYNYTVYLSLFYLSKKNIYIINLYKYIVYLFIKLYKYCILKIVKYPSLNN